MVNIKDLFGSFKKSENKVNEAPKPGGSAKGAPTLISKMIDADSKEDFERVASEARVAVHFKNRGVLLEIEPKGGVVELRLRGDRGDEFAKLKTPIEPLTKDQATGFLDEARNIFFIARKDGRIKKSEKAILVIDATGTAGLAEPLDGIKEGLSGQVKTYEKHGIDPEVGQVQILVKEGDSQDSCRAIVGNMRTTTNGNKKAYSIDW